MGLLDRVKSYINKTNESHVFENNTHEYTTSSCNCVINEHENLVGEVGDKLTRINSNTSSNIHETIRDKQLKIVEKCKIFGVKKEEAFALLKDFKFSKQEYVDIPDCEKIEFLNCVEIALNHYIYDNKTLLLKNSDKIKVIKQTASNYINTRVKNGTIDPNKFEKFTSTIKKVKTDYENAGTIDQKIEILMNARKEIYSNINNYYNKLITNCANEEEKKLLEKERERAFSAITCQAVLDFKEMSSNPKDAAMAVYLKKGDEQAEARKIIFESTKSEYRTEIAKEYTHEFNNKMLKVYYEDGDAISAEEYGRVIQYTTQFMDLETVTKYEQDSYEFRQKVENGEIDAPWLTKEHIANEIIETVNGIKNNTNISSDKKVELIEKIENHARNLSDYEAIKSKIKIDKNTQCDNNNLEICISQKLPEKLPHTENDVNYKNNNTQTTKQNMQEEIKIALKTNSIENVKKMFKSISDKDIVDIIVHQPTELKNLLPKIENFIETVPVKDLYNMIHDCNTEIFLFALRHRSPKDARLLFEMADKNDGLNFYCKNLGKHYLETTNNNL